MKYKGIFFDLDGTLLPMDQRVFTKGYFQELGQALAPLGIGTEELVAAMWAGIRAMVNNDGAHLNRELFWEGFQQSSGREPAQFVPTSDRFYETDFQRVKRFTGENSLAKQAVALAHKRGEKVVLATNPLFPLAGQLTRMQWVGLQAADFDMVTAYETDRFCKPNPEYYLDVCRRVELEPEDCLMIGNDDREDMQAATAAGLHTYLVTDCRIPDPETPWQGRQGSFVQMLTFLEQL